VDKKKLPKARDKLRRPQRDKMRLPDAGRDKGKEGKSNG